MAGFCQGQQEQEGDTSDISLTPETKAEAAFHVPKAKHFKSYPLTKEEDIC